VILGVQYIPVDMLHLRGIAVLSLQSLLFIILCFKASFTCCSDIGAFSVHENSFNLKIIFSIVKAEFSASLLQSSESFRNQFVGLFLKPC